MAFVIHTRSLYLYCSFTALALLLLTLVFTTPREALTSLTHHVADNLLSLSASSTCPNPYLTTLNPHTSLSSVVEPLPLSAECTELPTASDDFTVVACRHASYCNALDLTITRKDTSSCKEVEDSMRDSPVSDDTRLTAIVRESLGPDAFMVVTDGGERTARYVPDAYLGGCSYRFSLRFDNAGPLSLQIWHHYDHYFSYWENNMEWPPQSTERLLLQNPLFFETCPSCHSFVAPPGVLNATILPDAGINLGSTSICSSTAPVYGSYIPVSFLETHNVGNFYEPLPANQNEYHFIPQGECHYTHAGLRYSEHDACFALPKTQVLLHGDSHMRVMYDGIVHRLQGNQWTLVESEKSGHKNESFVNRYLDFQWDPAGDGLLSLTCDEIQSFDVFAFSIGHHLHRMTTAAYTEVLDQIFSGLSTTSRDCPTSSGRTRRLVYISPPAVVPREDHFVQEVKDRRTNIRITHWVSIGLELANKYGWSSVDQFHLTAPFVRESKDDAHFIETDALDPLLDDVIAKLGICDLSQA